MHRSLNLLRCFFPVSRHKKSPFGQHRFVHSISGCRWLFQRAQSENCEWTIYACRLPVSAFASSKSIALQLGSSSRGAENFNAVGADYGGIGGAGARGRRAVIGALAGRRHSRIRSQEYERWVGFRDQWRVADKLVSSTPQNVKEAWQPVSPYA